MSTVLTRTKLLSNQTYGSSGGKTRVLLDTNIIIPREDNKVVPEAVQRLLSNLSANHVDVLVHPLSELDLAKDRNGERRMVVASKLRSYSSLDSFPDFSTDNEFKNTILWSGEQRRLVDMQLLYAVYKNAVDVLITRDLEIHKYASKLSIDDRVFDVEEASILFPPERGWSSRSLPLEEVPLWNIDLTDPIFDEQKKEYPEFASWWGEKSREGRKAIVNRLEDGRLGAILMLKDEDEAVPSNPPLLSRPRIKICTFKVVNNGHYLGELFVRMSIEMALKRHYQEIYFTHFTKEYDPLVSLTKQFGFEHVGFIRGKYQEDEDVYLKRIFPEYYVTNHSPSEIDRVYYPSFYDGEMVRKAIVPILPQYHERLFGLVDRRQSTLDKHTGAFIPEQNTIRKAYICRSKTRVSEGDVLLFYRSGDLKTITSVGVVESSHYNMRSPTDILRMVSRRSVYKRKDISELAHSGATVLLFKHNLTFRKGIPLNEMIEDFGIQAPQTISIIDNETYGRLIGRGGIDRRFIIH